jgi:hypothetical protein
MSKEDYYSGLSWMTEEMKNHLIERDKIVKEQNIDALFALKDNSDFSIALHEILISRYENNPDALSAIQLNLFLCMHLENAGQADHILSFLQEWFPQHSKDVVNALKDIGAIKSAELIKQAVELLPKDGSWFFKTADENSQTLMAKIDNEFSSYPDGMLQDLYRKYAENNTSEIYAKN